jgi:hypothetical protein
VGDTPLRHGAAERGSDVLLGDEIGELLGAVFAGERDHTNVQCRMINDQ